MVANFRAVKVLTFHRREGIPFIPQTLRFATTPHTFIKQTIESRHFFGIKEIIGTARSSSDFDLKIRGIPVVNWRDKIWVDPFLIIAFEPDIDFQVKYPKVHF
jgi:hypothetical protein